MMTAVILRDDPAPTKIIAEDEHDQHLARRHADRSTLA
jgi:hypothetical protein